MGLLPLEFTDCQTDSPYFRDNLSAHERELERTSQAVKSLIKDIKDLLTAARTLSKAQRNLANSFSTFSFECIGTWQTDDEMMIANSLKEFARLLCMIEDERDRMLESAQKIFIDPLDTFRSKQLGGVKEEKKKFDKETVKFYQQLERHLSISTKKMENLKESDASLELEQSTFIKTSLDYVLKLQEVHESKKFEIVERILSFMYRWFTFYHQGHEVANEFKSFTNELQMRLQRTRESFEATKSEAEQLRNKVINLPKLSDAGSLNKMYTRQGYLYLMEKKALSTQWTKYFCQYQKESKHLSMIAYSHNTCKIICSDSVTVKKCIRRSPDSIDKRFCFDVVIQNRPGVSTFQAVTEDDYKRWLDAMDGREYKSYNSQGHLLKTEDCMLDDAGFNFVKQCINVIENTGLQDQGLYRVVGVASKANKLISTALDLSQKNKINLESEEIKTVTSALKNFLRNLPEPLMTFRLHQAFLAAAKQENKTNRVKSIHSLVHRLPQSNRNMLELLIRHLHKVSLHADKNLMTASNLCICFGPTLLRPEEETMAAIMDIKFCNVTVRILIENCSEIFSISPDEGLGQKEQRPKFNKDQPSPMQSDHRISHLYANSKDLASTKNVWSNQNLSYWTGTNEQNFASIPPQSAETHSMYTSPALSQTVNPIPVGNGYPSAVRSTRSVNRKSATYSANPVWQMLPESLPCRDVEPRTWKTTSSEHPGNGNNYTVNSNAANSISLETRPQVLPLAKSAFHHNPLTSSSGKKVRTLYTCIAENELELSFKPNEIIYDVRPSKELGWLEGCHKGKVGLVPINYVEYIP